MVTVFDEEQNALSSDEAMLSPCIPDSRPPSTNDGDLQPQIPSAENALDSDNVMQEPDPNTTKDTCAGTYNLCCSSLVCRINLCIAHK